jgi:hypothetical protein
MAARRSRSWTWTLRGTARSSRSAAPDHRADPQTPATATRPLRPPSTPTSPPWDWGRPPSPVEGSFPRSITSMEVDNGAAHAWFHHSLACTTLRRKQGERQSVEPTCSAAERSASDRWRAPCSVTKREPPTARPEPGAVTTRQAPAVVRPANTSAARAGVAEAQPALGVSVEMNESRASEAHLGRLLQSVTEQPPPPSSRDCCNRDNLGSAAASCSTAPLV